MKKFNITVNGKTYEVEVEEVGGVSVASRPMASAAKTAPVPAAAPAAPKADPAPISAGGDSVTAPMPGKVLKVLKSEGSAVKNGDVVMILEAMKMENEITAPVDGNVKQIAAKEGVAVNPGDVLFVIG